MAKLNCEQKRMAAEQAADGNVGEMLLRAFERGAGAGPVQTPPVQANGAAQ